MAAFAHGEYAALINIANLRLHGEATECLELE
jgi:hypothetical protein